MKILSVLLILLMFPLSVLADEDEKEDDEELSLYERYEAIAGESVGRIRYSRNVEWRNVDENSLVAETRHGEYWLLDIAKGCIRRTPLEIELEDEQQGERRGMREIERLDTLIIDDTRCTIRQIRPLDADAVEAIRAEE